jgi:hypothetical protein
MSGMKSSGDRGFTTADDDRSLEPLVRSESIRDFDCRDCGAAVSGGQRVNDQGEFRSSDTTFHLTGRVARRRCSRIRGSDADIAAAGATVVEMGTSNQVADTRPIARRALLGVAAAAATGAALRSTPARAEVSGSVPLVFTIPDSGCGELAIERDGDNGIFALSGRSGWYGSKPPVRLRTSRETPDNAGGQHLLITPYEHGTAIEYDGVLEAWVQDFSIHNNQTQGSSWSHGARLWVGNDDDSGGLRLTARRSGAGKFGEIASQMFGNQSGGDLRFVVRDRVDSFDFRSGAPQDERTFLRITSNGQMFARYQQLEQVYVGAAGPAKQAGVAFGPSQDARVYREAPSRLRTDARFVAGGGIGLPTAEPAARLGQVVAKLEVFDDDGNTIGFVPIQAES